ncbi:hypothetical protein [Actinoplanes sp. NPDC051494]|uniref:hypothetical protein n=1 Tax=Actinoplanes sp. NPDC051494 TaxID=3363907 RepID=UPI003787B59C
MTTDSATPTPLAPPAEAHEMPSPELRRALRTIAGHTQGDVAREVGVSQWAVSYWERTAKGPGRRHFTRYLLLLMSYAETARELGLPITWPAQPSTSANPAQK